ncbi:MAG TPA: zinc ribbon domain-containing protein, partial [Dehalococcoidia bacterium]|nr:zinc ribbon domain-containing protein [Dehalococcoidia bacterium]
MTTDAAPVARPMPVPDDASKPFFDGAREHKLVLMRCRQCGAWRLPPRDRCDVCWSTETEWAQASGRATVYTFSIMHQL